jgi:hypothetical protein
MLVALNDRFMAKSISSAAQYVTLRKYFSQTSLVMYSFANPSINKTETGTANRWGITKNKPPGPIIMMGQSETLSSSVTGYGVAGNLIFLVQGLRN